MKIKLKNVKIIKSIVILVILSLLSTSAVGLLGYLDTLKMYNANLNIYNNVIPELSDWGEVDGHIGVLRNTLTKIIDRPFDSDNEKSMLDLNNSITKIISNNLDKSHDDKEIELIKKFQQSYEHYYSFIPDIIAQRKQGLVPDPKATNDDMGVYGKEIAAENSNLVNYQKEKAKKELNNSMTAYKVNIIRFVSILTLSIIVLSIISIFIIGGIRNSIKDFLNKVSILAKGDFTVKFDAKLTNEFGIMHKALSKTIDSIAEVISTVKTKSNSVHEESENLSKISEEMKQYVNDVSSSICDIATGSTDQSDKLILINDNLLSFSKSLDNIVNSVNKVDRDSITINEEVINSDKKLKSINVSITEIAATYNESKKKVATLSSSVSKITEITKIINSISDETNLLALNASIEAARAGDAGKGFAIVAAQIGELADQSKKSSKEIDSLLKLIEDQTRMVEETTITANKELEEQTSIIASTIVSYKNIVDLIGSIVPRVHEISDSIININKQKDNIVENLEASSSVAEENSAASEEISQSASEMGASAGQVSTSADDLKEVVKSITAEIEKFRVNK